MRRHLPLILLTILLLTGLATFAWAPGPHPAGLHRAHSRAPLASQASSPAAKTS